MTYMILNTGNRTEIPAFFPERFFRRLEAGFVYARNPYVPNQITEYTLDPSLVDIICFCTKNPAPLLRKEAQNKSRAQLLQSFRQYWQVTITPYGREIEPYVPPVSEVLRSFRDLSGRVGAERAAWRYDPVFLTEEYTEAFHCNTFQEMAESLRGFTHTVIISFLDLYAKTRRNFPEGTEVPGETQISLTRAFSEIARSNGMELRTCMESPELARYGADTTGCMTKEVLEHAFSESLQIPGSIGRSREGCDCLLGADIGAYNTCGHGCRYCYANYDRASVERNLRLHDPSSPLLLGHVQEGDRIVPARQSSYVTGQMTLF